MSNSHSTLRRARTVIGSYASTSARLREEQDTLPMPISPAPARRSNENYHRPALQKFWQSPITGGCYNDGYYTRPSQQSKAVYPDHEGVNVVNADPFATPPRAFSPQVGFEDDPMDQEDQEQEVGQSVKYQVYESEPEVFSPAIQAQCAEMAEMPTSLFFGEHTSQPTAFPKQIDNNPFTAEAWRQAHPNLPDMKRSEPHAKNKTQEVVDMCVAQLVEMGYGRVGGSADANDSEEVERLRVYAQIAHGNVDEALQMLEDEKTVWERQSFTF